MGGKVREQGGSPQRELSSGELSQASGRITHFWKRLNIQKVRVCFKQQNVSVSPNTAVFKGHLRINQKVPGMKDPPRSIGVTARGDAGVRMLKPWRAGGHVAGFRA